MRTPKKNIDVAEIVAVCRRARALGYAVAVRNGEFQLQTVSYDVAGNSTVTAITGFGDIAAIAAALDTTNEEN